MNERPSTESLEIKEERRRREKFLVPYRFPDGTIRYALSPEEAKALENLGGVVVPSRSPTINEPFISEKDTEK